MRSDRREFGWRTVMFGFLRSRRRNARRSEEGEVLFLDWHHPWLFFLATGTMLLSVADAVMTLQLLNLGMIEANPIMAWVLEHGTAAFVASKLALTAFGILTLVYMAKARFFNRIRAGLFLTALFSGYACLVCYEIVQLLHLS
jgi:Domain of unknown function (DUF5658)